jgi:hypothetical protein
MLSEKPTDQGLVYVLVVLALLFCPGLQARQICSHAFMVDAEFDLGTLVTVNLGVSVQLQFIANASPFRFIRPPVRTGERLFRSM